MSEATYVVDRKGWAPGPWDGEPDRVQWQSSGLACLAVRNRSGNWCGYVGVPREHPFYGVSYSAYEDGGDGETCDYRSLINVEVHGGLTYADKCAEDGPICHVAEPGLPEDVWWLGFDTAHAGDLSPVSRSDYMRGLYPALAEYETYKDLAYAKRETESLAEQLAAKPGSTRNSGLLGGSESLGSDRKGDTDGR